jgi:hypothetical protein
MNDDEQWLNALAGRASASVSASTELEARMLRAAVRQSPGVTVPAITGEDEQRLLTAVTAIRQIKAPRSAWGNEPAAWRCSGCAQRWQLLLQWFKSSPKAAFGTCGAGLLAGLAVFAVVEGWQSPQLAFDTLPPAMRSSNQAELRVIAVDDPQAFRNQLANEMSAQGAQVRRYQRLGRFGIDARLPDPLPQALQQSLMRLEVPAAVTVVRLEFEAKTP